jgi:hypothetical protein
MSRYSEQLEKAKNYMQKAYDVVHSSPSHILEVKRLRDDLVKEIDADKNISPDGKFAAKIELKKLLAIPVLRTAHTRKQEYVSHLSRAVKLTDPIVYSKPPKPDAVTLERFEDEFKKLKTEIQISPRADFAYKKLMDFVNKIDNAYFAHVVREQFGEIASLILSVPNADGQIRQNLSRVFGELQTKFETDELREARSLYEAANEMLQDPKIYRGPVVNDAVTDIIGMEYAKYIDNTDEFFAIEGNEEHKPEDYKEEYDADLDPYSRKSLLREQRDAMWEWSRAKIDYHTTMAEIARRKVSAIEERLRQLGVTN